ncbi:MAG TPA: hypothetical protein VM638_06060, partial [Actinomycetota bacterium]|nr:hypothetical protein [Actinomycetota bacterium]
AITSDNAGPVSDPALGHVFWGKNAAVKTAEVVNNPSGGSQCVTIRMRVTVPAGSTRYLLFFTEMSNSNGAAQTSISKFNTEGLSSSLLTGIKSSVRSKIVNWNL